MRSLLLLVLVLVSLSSTYAVSDRRTANRRGQQSLQAGATLPPSVSSCTPGDIVVIGCNRCTCLSTGDMICTSEPGCVVPEGTTSSPTALAGTCVFGGIEYVQGKTVDRGDGCNTCVCSVDSGASIWKCTDTVCNIVSVSTSSPTIHSANPTSAIVPDGKPPLNNPSGQPIQGATTTSTRSGASSLSIDIGVIAVVGAIIVMLA